MIRTVLLVLLIFNGALMLAHQIKGDADDSAGAGPLGVNAEKVIILPAVAHVVVPARCLELGPFSTLEVDAVRQRLRERSLDELSFAAEVPLTNGWWVFVPPRNSHTDAIKRAKELDRLGIRGFHVFEDGPNKHAISLGVFKSEAAAQSFLGEVNAKGFKGARMDRQQQRMVQHLFYVRSAVPEVVARVTEVKAQFDTAELRQVACPASKIAGPLAN